jgi:hypothetical protein
MKKYLLVILCYGTVALSVAQTNESPKVYLPGVVSTGYNERDMAISPDGSEMFYTIQALRSGVSVIIHRTAADQWKKGEAALFSGQYSDLEPAFSPDGKKLFFVSNRPLTAGTEKNDFDIWYVEKKGQGWGEPIHAGMEINSAEDEWYPSVTDDGSVYFTGARSDALGKEDIYRAQWKNGKFETPVNIGTGVNSKLDEFNAFADPKEQYILFSAEGGEGDLGRGDLYISYRNGDGTWSKAKNLGPAVNSNRLDYCPFVYKGVFYFTSDRPGKSESKKMSFAEIKSKLDTWGNGWGDIYSMPAAGIVTK